MNNHYADQRKVFLAPLEICIYIYIFFFFHFVQKLNNKFYYSFKRFTNSMSSSEFLSSKHSHVRKESLRSIYVRNPSRN